MIKAKDPAFLFYPGDASEDTQFMNRLERGAYFDLVKAQRMFNHGFTTAQLRKILGSDFEAVWPSLEIILTQEGELYFIDWLKKSFEKREEYSKKQSERSKKGWQSRGIAVAIPQKEDGNENEIKIENLNLKKGVVGEKNFEPLHGKFIEAWKLWISCRSKKFKNEASEAIGRKKFFELCREDENLAFPIVEQSIANGWAGLFEVKNNSPGKLEIQVKSKQEQQSDRIKNVAQNLIKSLKDNSNADIRPMEITQVHG